jgi:16S rRNA (cytidine1402-2'-O)-methyltransferase
MPHARPSPDPPTAHERSATYTLNGHAVAAPALMPGLHVVATPIGNLRDITIRALETLAAADLIACEDTRVTRRLLDHYAIRTPLTPYHDHNGPVARPRLLQALADGRAVALASDAGTPLISDPGFKLVRAVAEAGYPVSTAPGASAVLAALTVSGLPTDRFCFEGFLPAKPGARRARIAALAREAMTLVLFESGPRLADTLADLADGLGGREAAICRELTKRFEEVRRGALTELAAFYGEAAEPRGEIVIVIAPPEDTAAVTQEDVDRMLAQALQRASVKDAVAEVAGITGESRAAIYKRALALRAGDDASDR